jgi:hypothetical protein
MQIPNMHASIRPVKQLHSMGCGAACVAFIANRSYTITVKYLGESKAQTSGFRLRELTDGLQHFGLDYVPHHAQINKRRRLPNTIYDEGTIVFIEKSERYPYGHYLVRVSNGWMDPWINIRSHDISLARAGFRKRLPGKPKWMISRARLPTVQREQRR